MWLSVLGIALGVFACRDTTPPEHYRVPRTAPDTAPTALWDSITAPANLLHSPRGITGSVVRDLVYVRFRPQTSQQDRRAAIDLVHGRVVGGMAIGEEEQFYAVRIPYVLAPDDSTSGPILRAQAALTRLPMITDVLLGLMDMMKPTSLRPNDGATFAQWDMARRPALAQQRPRRPNRHVIKAGTSAEAHLMRPLCEDSFSIGDTITARLHSARVVLAPPRWWPDRFIVSLRRVAPARARDPSLLRFEVIRAIVDGVVVHDVQGTFSVDVESMHMKAGTDNVPCFCQLDGWFTKTLRVR